MTLTAISVARLKTCHPDLQRVVELAATRMPLFVLCGYRGRNEQNKAFEEGKSKLRFPRSMHNKKPSMAVDISPSPLDWLNHDAFKKLALVMKKAAKELGVDIVWGGDWVGFKDLPHYQLSSVETDQSA